MFSSQINNVEFTSRIIGRKVDDGEENEVNSKRDVGLDFIKVLSTVAVVRLHAGHAGFAGPLIYYMSGIAVPLFLWYRGH